MSFFQIYFQAFMVIMAMMLVLWLISIFIKNVSIVDIFWGFGFVLASAIYFMNSDGHDSRNNIIMILAAIWGLRLSIYLAWRNIGNGEDYRYRELKKLW